MNERIGKVLRIAICDDDLVFASQVETLLINVTGKKLIKAAIEVYSDGCELWNDITNAGKMYDIVYLDIKMMNLNGIDVAKKIREKDSNTIIIYISSYENYMIELFEVEAFRFIKKPIDGDIFEQYFDKAYERILQDEGYYEYKFNKIPHKVLLKDIIYFESYGRRVHVKHINGTGQFYKRLNVIEQELQSCKIPFLRIHQSFLINYRFVSSISFSNVKMNDGTVLQISEDRRKTIRKQCNDLMESEFSDV